MHHQRDPREEGVPWFAPPRIDGNNLRPELRDQLEKLDREALWKADEKGGKGATYDLPNFARIQVYKQLYRTKILLLLKIVD